MLTIEQYTAPYKEKVVAHILAIQRDEFAIAITRADQPDLDAIETFYRQGAGNFWLALDAGAVVGTVALVDIGNGQAALRKMFVRPAYRGNPHKTADRLLAALFEWSRAKGLREIYLGTTDKFLAAHRFYAKTGFAEISQAELPAAFPVMKVDSKFYKYLL
jgi:N-acetylglutamate synthase-like GNAT family acetyltransferase